MSRGRQGTSREHYHRHTHQDPQTKEDYHKPVPTSLYLRPGPQHSQFSNFYHSPSHPAVPLQPPTPFLLPPAPPIPNPGKAAPKPGALNSQYNLYHAPNSFQYQQVEFLRGQSSEAPQFRRSPCGVGEGVVPRRLHSSSYQLQPSYSRFAKPSSSPRGRGVYGQDQYLPRSLQGTPDQKFLNRNQLQDQNYNQNRQWCFQTDSLSENFQRLTLHQVRPNRGEGFDKYSASSSSAYLGVSKVNITLTPDIQDQVYRALAALKPSENTSAKLLARKLRLPKTIVNKALYSLERTQKASKQGLLPPVWTVYREHLRGDPAQNSSIESPPSPLFVVSEQPSEAKLTVHTETAENLRRDKKEDSDTESSSSNCSSLVSSDSEEFQTTAKGQHPLDTGSPDQERTPSTMTDQKEGVLQYLLNSGEATALVIAKNLGLKTTKQVNPTLYALEKQGDVVKHGEVNPPTWELTTHRRERMERSLKAAQSNPAHRDQMEVEAGGNEEESESVLQPSSSLLSIPGLESIPLLEGWSPEQSQNEAVGKILL